MSVTLIFACGHRVTLEDIPQRAVCLCGETRVSDVQARPPRFRGACQGPHAETVTLDPVPVIGTKDAVHG